MDKIDGSVAPCFTGLSIRFAPYGFAFRIGILSSFRFDSPMQAMIVAMVGFALHTRETLPLHNMCADITFRLGWFERRGQSGKAASMPYGDHGFASHAATEGDHAVCRRDDGFLLVGEQVDAPMPWKPLLFPARHTCQLPACRSTAIASGLRRIRTCRPNSFSHMSVQPTIDSTRAV